MRNKRDKSPFVIGYRLHALTFQRIPHATEMVQQAHDIRKNCESPFNLLKNQTGLETLRVRSQHATTARCTLSSIAVLLIKMAGTRKKWFNF